MARLPPLPPPLSLPPPQQLLTKKELLHFSANPADAAFGGRKSRKHPRKKLGGHEGAAKKEGAEETKQFFSRGTIDGCTKYGKKSYRAHSTNVTYD